MTSTLKGGGGLRQNEMLSDVGSATLASVLDVQFFVFLLKKTGFAP